LSNTRDHALDRAQKEPSNEECEKPERNLEREAEK